MTQKSWVSLISIVIVLIALGAICILIFVPQKTATMIETGYTSLNQNDYDYASLEYGNQTLPEIQSPSQEKFEVENYDISQGQKNNDYIPGNINPFTPPMDITIYNEPGYSNGTGTGGGSTGSSSGGSSGNGEALTGK